MVTLPFPPNQVRWPRDRGGHRESYPLTLTAPDGSRALWLGHGLLAARGSDAPPSGELGAVLFDRGGSAVAWQVVPSHGVDLAPGDGIVRVGEATLSEGGARGRIPAADGRAAARWDLVLEGDEPPILPYPDAWMYSARFPGSKTLTARPRLTALGSAQVGDTAVEVDGWTGRLVHEWGRGHAFDHARGGTGDFRERDDARFEGFTARVRLGPLTSPRLTACVLRLGSTDYAFNAKRRWLGGGHYGFPHWSFQVEGKDGYRLSGRIEADRDRYVGLRAADPAGALADRLLTPFGKGEVVLERRVVGRWEEIQRLTSETFDLEFLFRDVDHGVPVVGGDPFESRG